MRLFFVGGVMFFVRRAMILLRRVTLFVRRPSFDTAVLVIPRRAARLMLVGATMAVGAGVPVGMTAGAQRQQASRS